MEHEEDEPSNARILSQLAKCQLVLATVLESLERRVCDKLDEEKEQKATENIGQPEST